MKKKPATELLPPAGEPVYYFMTQAERRAERKRYNFDETELAQDRIVFQCNECFGIVPNASNMKEHWEWHGRIVKAALVEEEPGSNI